VSARKAGRDWARREWDALSEKHQNEQTSVSGAWISDANDARPLVAFDPSSDEECDERQLAEICNDAAREEWSEIVLAHEDSDSYRLFSIRRAISNLAMVRVEDVSIWSESGSNPEGSRWRETDAAELRAVLDDDFGSPPDDAGPDGNWRAAWEEDRRVVEQAIEMLDRGARVFMARDEDGLWFADLSAQQ